MQKNQGSNGKQKRGMRKLALAAVLVVALGGGGLAAANWFGQKESAPVATVTVTLGDVERTVTALGKIKPKDYVDVGTQVSGQLEKVHVEVGDKVKQGDLIAEIDSTVYETRVRTGRANLDNLRAQLVQQQAEAELAERQLERNRALLKEKAISRDTVETGEATLKVAQARVKATQAQIRAAEATLAGDLANVGYTRILAPMSGTVVSQTSLEGQTVNAAQQAPVIVRVANLETMTVWAQVAEADVTKVKAGMPAWFTTLGDSERRWQGTVRQVMPTPETVNDVVLYNVLVDVDNSEQILMTDMTVQVFFVLEQAKDAPVVPLSALRALPGKGPRTYEASVMTARGIEKRVVTVDVASRTSAAVSAGLAAGDKVVVPQASAGPAEGAPAGGRRGMGPRL